MNILLINPMASRKTPKKGRPAHFPVGLGLVCAYLRENGFGVDILDNETECLNKYELRDFIERSDHDCYGMTAMSPQYGYVKGLSKLIKTMKGRPVILGGPLATYSSDIVLKNTDVDICVIGEGEETAVDLLRNLSRLENVSGIAYKMNGKTVTNVPRIYQKNRDDYPFADYESFNIDPYLSKSLIQYETKLAARFLNPLRNSIQLRTIGMITGVGCPYRCNFCSRSVAKARLYSVDRIIDEIMFLQDKFQIDGLSFFDELLLTNKSRALEFCRKIKPLNLIWSGQGRANILDNDIAKAMKEAGCIGIGLGIESGSNRILKGMRKAVTAEQNEEAMKVAMENNLVVGVQLLFGYPGERSESIEETIELFKRTEVPPRRFNILTPLPGSSIYDKCLKEGLIEDEDKYLEQVSRYETGFGSKKVLINLTEMTNEGFEDLLKYAETTMEKNFEDILKARHRPWFIKNICLSLLRYANRATKILQASAWKRKLKAIAGRTKGRVLTREQIEELYFNLQISKEESMTDE